MKMAGEVKGRGTAEKRWVLNRPDAQDSFLEVWRHECYINSEFYRWLTRS